MIQIENLSRRFGNVIAVDDFTLSVDEGEVFGLIGPNGAGKTTTIRMLCCLIRPTSGGAFIKGNDICNREDAMRIRQMVGLLPESPGLYERLSAYQNLSFYAQLYDMPKEKREKRIEELLKMLGMWKRRDKPIATFSKGMRQKIAIARALVHEPEILFLDEPTAGLDPLAAARVRDFILDLKKEGRTIFLNTHNLDEAERICDRIGVINQRLIALGSPKELAQKFWGRTTVVHLEEIDDDILDAVRSIAFVKNVRSSNNKLFVDVEDPDIANPLIASTIIEKGGKIQFITELKHKLEDVYIELIGGSDEA